MDRVTMILAFIAAAGISASLIIATQGISRPHPVSITREIGMTAGFTVTMSDGRTFECMDLVSAEEVLCSVAD